MELLLNSLNESQKEAAVCIDEHVRIVAGAGSGKTRVLMARIEYLLKEIGVYPSRILAITFTNKAAQEMKDRLHAQVGDLADQVRISTIHALCVRMLREDAAAAGYPKSFAILDADDQKTVLNRIYKRLGLSTRDIPLAEMTGSISRWKRESIDPSSLTSRYRRQRFKVQIYEEYLKDLQSMKAMDFDDLLLEACRLLKENPDIREKWQNRLDYLHVDEFQDVDPIQYSIVRQLVRDDAILAVVGDPDQTIYTWRGASVEIIMNFERDFHPSKTVLLTQNYRSTEPILHASNVLIENNRNRVEKELFTKLDGSDPIELIEGEDEEEEAAQVVRQIILLHQEGVAWEDMAILYRSNYLSRPFEKALSRVGIPYHIFGGFRFYERAEIKDMLAYLRLLQAPDPEDPRQMSLDLPLERIINTPKRSMGPKFMEELGEEARSEGLNLLQAARSPQTMKAGYARKAMKFYALIETLKTDLRRNIENGELPEIIDDILEQTGYGQMLREQKEEGEARLENIMELKADLQRSLEENPSLTLEDYLQNIALLSEQNSVDSSHAVSLMTIHAAKGTEFLAVFVAGLNESVFPSNRAIQDSGKLGLEEERRLMYVAMTRARRRLALSWNHGYSFQTKGPKFPSRFLTEIPDPAMSLDEIPVQEIEEKGRDRKPASKKRTAAGSGRRSGSRTLDERRKRTAAARKEEDRKSVV